jgi:hypothetical protein
MSKKVNSVQQEAKNSVLKKRKLAKKIIINNLTLHEIKESLWKNRKLIKGMLLNYSEEIETAMNKYPSTKPILSDCLNNVKALIELLRKVEVED